MFKLSSAHCINLVQSWQKVLLTASLPIPIIFATHLQQKPSLSALRWKLPTKNVILPQHTPRKMTLSTQLFTVQLKRIILTNVTISNDPSCLFLFQSMQVSVQRSASLICSPDLEGECSDSVSFLVLKGPVLRTTCGPETGPNWTETDRTFGPGPCF